MAQPYSVSISLIFYANNYKQKTNVALVQIFQHFSGIHVMSSKVVAAGFIIFRTVSRKIQYLLLQASDGVNHWTPPKGTISLYTRPAKSPVLVNTNLNLCASPIRTNDRAPDPNGSTRET